MLREHANIKEFKNGNINLKFDRSLTKEAEQNAVLVLRNLLSEFDCYFIGETYCLCNYGTGHSVYNAHSDLVYNFFWSDLEALKQRKTVKLFARKPTRIDREILKREGH